MLAQYLLVITLVASAMFLVYNGWPRESLIRSKVDASYDYIIIGAGSAGCVIANRLSGNPRYKVLLIEAGDEENLNQYVDIPLVSFELQRTPMDWQYTTTPQEHCCGSYENNQMFWPRGKALGGSSNLNYMIYVRGNSKDYDSWAANGAEGWSYEDVLPYFKKSENNKNKKYVDSGMHGLEGPMYVTDLRQTKVVDTFLGAAKEIGEDLININAGEQNGFGPSQGTIFRGSRWSAAKAFLRPVIHRLNLHTITNAHVTKIIIKSNVVTGVEFMRNDTIYTIKAKKEVILSAGAIGSPQILMLSGIGPREHLQSLGIPIVADLPVGNNLQDHIYPFGMEYFFSDPVGITQENAKSLLSLAEYLLFGKGILSTSGVEASGFMRSKHQPANESVPYLQFHFLPTLAGCAPTREKSIMTRNKINMKSKVWHTMFDDMNNMHGMMFLPILLHPKSRGTIRLKSKDPFDHPLINPNYLEHPDDMKILLEGVRIVQKLAKTRAFKKHGTKSTERKHPYCKHLPEDSDDYWLCYIKENIMSVYHPVGTCKMGAADDPTAVVDHTLKVRGIRGLRVADASIMPEIISGNTNAPTTMIAERAYDLIMGRVTVDKNGRDLDRIRREKREHMHVHHGEL